MDEFLRLVAPHLTANLLTIGFVYCLLMISKNELRGKANRIYLYFIPLLVVLIALQGVTSW